MNTYEIHVEIRVFALFVWRFQVKITWCNDMAMDFVLICMCQWNNLKIKEREKKPVLAESKSIKTQLVFFSSKIFFHG